VLIGLILGPFAEVQLRRALQISQGDWLALVSTQISGTLILLSLLLLVGPPLLRAWHARKLNEARADA
jgi:putative tricarboxylic transport membrane protein